jgi:Icc protein
VKDIEERQVMAGVQNHPVQFGQHSPASHLIAHISDTHFLGGSRALYGTVDTDTPVRQALAQLERSGLRPDALVFTGDIADAGEPDAYRRVRALVLASAERLGARVVWVMGNHDKRGAFRAELLGDAPADDPADDPADAPADDPADDPADAPADDPADAPVDAPVDAVFDLNGLRLIALDSCVAGYHHGELTQSQLDWLAEVLRTPAQHGTLLALHHPPIPTMVPLMSILELRGQDRLAAVIRGSDIRAILGGHLHYATTGSFAGIPVSVAAATCYTLDVSAPQGELVGRSGGQSITLVHVHDDQIVHSTVPLGEFDVATRFDADFLARMETLTPEERTEAFSRKVGAAPENFA